nr:MAG TPA: hypothetical protein [Caudoviricetes sp.]
MLLEVSKFLSLICALYWYSSIARSAHRKGGAY